MIKTVARFRCLLARAKLSFGSPISGLRHSTPDGVSNAIKDCFYVSVFFVDFVHTYEKQRFSTSVSGDNPLDLFVKCITINPSKPLRFQGVYLYDKGENDELFYVSCVLN